MFRLRAEEIDKVAILKKKYWDLRERIDQEKCEVRVLAERRDSLRNTVELMQTETRKNAVFLRELNPLLVNPSPQ